MKAIWFPSATTGARLHRISTTAKELSRNAASRRENEVYRGEDRIMSVLALDLATDTGWAVRCDDGSAESGVWSLREGRRELDLSLSLIRSAWPDEIETIVIEQPIMYRGRPSNIRVAFGLRSIVRLECQKNRIAFEEIPPATVKKAATGKGNAGKPLVLSCMEIVFKKKLMSYDEADALAVLFAWESMK